MIEITSCTFHRHPEPHVAYKEVGASDEVTLALAGNAFLLNNDGNTIESFFLKR